MASYNEFISYSPLLDCRVARISMVDERNQEYFAMIPAEPMGKAYRERRQRACEAIDAAIADGRDPGEVTMWSEDDLG
jgi:hypothetical protein